MSSNKLSASKDKKGHSSSSSKKCDFGESHVARDKYEDYRHEARDLRARLEQRDAELLQYHNELGELQAKLEDSENRVKDLQRDLKEAEAKIDVVEDDYDKLVEEHNELVEERDKLEKELASVKQELRPLKRERSRSPAVDPEEYKRLKTESQDLRKRLTQLETTAEERDRLLQEAEDLRRQIQISRAFTPEVKTDLSPLQHLHPKLTAGTPEELAAQIVEILTFDLNDIWAHLPRKQEEALVTPSTRRLDLILHRLKEAVVEDAKTPLLPRLRDAENQIRDLELELKEQRQKVEKAEKDRQRLSQKLGGTVQLQRTLEKWEALGKYWNEFQALSPEDASSRVKATLETLDVTTKSLQLALREKAALEEQGKKAWLTYCPDPENIRTPQELREWIAGLKRQEDHATSLVVANQAVIFEWENSVGLPLLGEKERELTPQNAGKKLQELIRRAQRNQERVISGRATYGERVELLATHKFLLDLLCDICQYGTPRWDQRPDMGGVSSCP